MLRQVKGCFAAVKCIAAVLLVCPRPAVCHGAGGRQVLGQIRGPEGSLVRLHLARPAAASSRRLSYTAALTRASLPVV